MSLYVVLKFIHILAAITAVGSNITYGVWSVRAQRDRAHFGFVLKGIKFLDDRIANPAYGVLLLTGLVLLAVGHIAITTLWVIIALVLFVAVVVFGLAFYSPLVKNQIRLVEAGDTSSPAFERLLRQNRVFGPVLGVIVVVILVMMVFQPHL